MQLGRIATKSLDDLAQLGVQKANLYGYKCLLYRGFYLVIINENYQEVEYAYHHLEQYDQVDVAIHFNAV